MGRAPRWYRHALRIFPARIRDVHGAEMEEMFADAWTDARRKGRRAQLGLALRSARDLASNGVVARCEAFFRGGIGMETWGQDLSHALRGLARRPAFALIAIATIGLGIGGNVAIYGIIDSAYVDALPYPDDHQLVVPYNTQVPSQGIGFAAFSAPFHAALGDAGGFAGIASIAPEAVNVGGADRPERVLAARVSASFFEVAGVPPSVGRTFAAEEDRPGGPPVAVISDGLWTRRFARDPGLLGRTATMDGVATTVLGVMPPGFGMFFDGVDAWLPARMDEAAFDATSAVNNNRVLVARLPEGSTIEAVAQRLPAAVERMRERFPDAVSDEHAVSLVPLRRHLYGSARGSLFILLGAVGLVQLIACANLANLLLVRAEERRTELAVRAALGAGRIRLVRGVLTESLALSLLGAAAGLLVAMLMLEAVRPLAPANVPMPDGIARDGSVLLLTLLAAIATGLGFGLIPAWTAARKDLRDTLVEGARSGTSRRRARARGTLVVAEVALTAILLVGAGLMLNTLWRLQSVDPGFGTEDRTAADIDLDAGRYPDPMDLNLFHRGLIEQIEASSGVEAAGLAQFLPLRDASNWGLEVEDRMDAGVVVADYNLVTPGYLDAMGMRVVSGRDITWDDAEPDAAPVLMVSEAMADRLWPGEDPIGRRINIDLASRVWREVVGVVSDVRNRSLAQPPGDLLYFPPVDLPMADPRGMSVVVHHPGDATAAADIRRIVTALDAAVPLTQLRDLSEIARASEARRLFVLVLLAMFAGLALVLAAVGLYGVVSYTFALRTREIGLRMAVGAGRGSVLGMVARQSAALVGSGLVVGLVGSAALARLLGSLLYEVGTTDATTYAAVIVFLGLVGGAATWIPARRATSVDPATILRS